MTQHHVVVDGSNLATEGRSLPSLAQLDEAVRAYAEEDPEANIIVVVDATFGHRIDERERPTFDLAIEHGELLTPPAGAVGRGDAFILKIALRADAVVLSNDSFQEFHAEHPWLFEEGRLIGGKPVPGVGWIFTARTPVRGVKSRQVTSKAAKASRAAPVEAAKLKVGLPDGTKPKVGDVLEMPTVAAPAKKATKRVSKKAQAEALAAQVAEAPAEPVAAPAKKATKRVSKRAQATEPVPEAPAPRQSSRRRSAPAPTEPVNDALPFLTFVATYALGDSVVGEVTRFTSHGAMVEVALPDDQRLECYAPVKRLGDPPPAKAREVLSRGEVATFLLCALDPSRRVAELGLP